MDSRWNDSMESIEDLVNFYYEVPIPYGIHMEHTGDCKVLELILAKEHTSDIKSPSRFQFGSEALHPLSNN